MNLKIEKILFWFVLTLLLGTGLVVRFYDLMDAPMDFNSTRQLHSALIARGMYYQNLDSALPWQRDVAVKQWQAEGLIEPPILETLTALTYRLVGTDALWVARVYSILFWITGGLFLFALAVELAGPAAGLMSLAYFLILPFGSIASRAFQPDPLLTSMIIISWWAMVMWKRRQRWGWLIAAALISGLAIFTKTTAVFFIAPAWAGLVLAEMGIRKAVKSAQVWTAAGLNILPYLLFLIYGVFISGKLASQFGLRFFPNLWSDPLFYLQWNGQIRGTLGFEWFLLALVGTAFIKNKTYRIMFLSAWVGYFIYGLTLPFHISTHDYYQLPMMALVGLGLGCGAGAFFEHIPTPRWLSIAVVLGVAAFAVTILSWDTIVSYKRTDFTNEVIFWQKLGDRIGHEKKVIGLTQDYGYRLSYYGWVDNENWMTSNDYNYRELAGMEIDEASLFKDRIKDKDIFVVTLFDEVERQPKLKSMLSHFVIIEQAGDYVIYDLHQMTSPLQ